MVIEVLSCLLIVGPFGLAFVEFVSLFGGCFG